MTGSVAHMLASELDRAFPGALAKFELRDPMNVGFKLEEGFNRQLGADVSAIRVEQVGQRLVRHDEINLLAARQGGERERVRRTVPAAVAHLELEGGRIHG